MSFEYVFYARVLGKYVGQGCWARVLGKGVGQGCWARVLSKYICLVYIGIFFWSYFCF